jgi:hypothetical protein
MRISLTTAIIGSLNNKTPLFCYGHTGTVIKTFGRGKYKKFRVKLDGSNKPVELFEDEIFFPDHEDGYNQPGCR